MRGVIITFLSIFVLIVAFLVVRTFYDGARYAVTAAAGEAHAGHFTIGGSAPQTSGPYTIHGTAIMDTSQGIPAVPYIQYQNANHATSTKQLVYMGQRACAPQAGDFPCVPPYHATDGYPQLTTGQAITVTGYIYENRFLITSLSAS